MKQDQSLAILVRACGSHQGMLSNSLNIVIDLHQKNSVE